MRRYIFLFLSITFSFSLETVAIIDFEGIGVSQSEAKALTQRLTTEIIQIGKFTIVERSEMKRLLNEQKFQYSGCVDISCAVEIGKLLGAKSMVVGSVSKLGKTYSIDSRLIDVKTGESYISTQYSVKGEIDELFNGMREIAYKLCEMELPENLIKKTSSDNDRVSLNISIQYLSEYGRYLRIESGGEKWNFKKKRDSEIFEFNIPSGKRELSIYVANQRWFNWMWSNPTIVDYNFIESKNYLINVISPNLEQSGFKMKPQPTVNIHLHDENTIDSLIIEKLQLQSFNRSFEFGISYKKDYYVSLFQRLSDSHNGIRLNLSYRDAEFSDSPRTYAGTIYDASISYVWLARTPGAPGSPTNSFGSFYHGFVGLRYRERIWEWHRSSSQTIWGSHNFISPVLGNGFIFKLRDNLFFSFTTSLYYGQSYSPQVSGISEIGGKYIDSDMSISLLLGY